VYTKESTMSSGINKMAVPINNFASGIYFYTLITKEGTASGKLVKK
jgi:ribosomal protein S6